jgi:hypothetical protein
MFRIGGPLALANAVKFFAAFALWLFMAKASWDGLREAGAGKLKIDSTPD